MEVDRDELEEIIKDSIEDIFFSEEEYAPFNSLNDKVTKLLHIGEREENLRTNMKYADKFEDYMKNIDKLNMMINEFKGLVSIVRGECKLIETENFNMMKQLRKILKILSEEES